METDLEKEHVYQGIKRLLIRYLPFVSNNNSVSLFVLVILDVC